MASRPSRRRGTIPRRSGGTARSSPSLVARRAGCRERLRILSHRLLGTFARVRRWDNTDDVARNVAMRLHRALGQTVPESPRGLMGLMATRIQRELIDLLDRDSAAAAMGSAIRTLGRMWQEAREGVGKALEHAGD